MKKILALTLGAIIAFQVVGCGEPIITSMPNTDVETSNPLETEGLEANDAFTDDVLLISTQSLADDKDSNLTELIHCQSKKLENYTLEDCKLILNSAMGDICDAYSVDIALEPNGGLLLPNTTLASPVIVLSKGIVVICPYKNDEEFKLVVDPGDCPTEVFLYGEKGTSIIFEEFQFGMALEHDLLRMATDATFNIFEAGESYPAKQITRVKDGVIAVLTFERDSAAFYLDNMCLSLE